MIQLKRTLTALIFSLLVPLSVSGGDTLRRLVPSDVSFYLRVNLETPADSSPEVAHLKSRLTALKEALAAVPFMKNFDEALRTKELSEARRKERQFWRTVVESGSWWKLFEREFVLAGRLEYRERAWLAAFRLAPGELDVMLAQWQELLFVLASVVPDTELDVAQRDGVEFTCLYNLRSPGLVLCTGGRDDVLILSTSKHFLRQSLQLIDGKSSDLPHELARSSSALDRLAKESKFLAANLERGEKRPVAGFEFEVTPLALFPVLIGEDALLSSWEQFAAAGDVVADGDAHSIVYFIESTFPAGQEELERVFYRSLLSPVAETDLEPVLYREAGVILPPREKGIPTPVVSLLLAEWAAWLRSGFNALDVEHSLTATKDGEWLRGRGQLQLRAR